MAMQELTHVVTVTEPGEETVSVYGPVEIAWYQDHLKITALGAGPASITEWYFDGNDIIVELRPPSLDELPERVPGAD